MIGLIEKYREFIDVVKLRKELKRTKIKLKWTEQLNKVLNSEVVPKQKYEELENKHNYAEKTAIEKMSECYDLKLEIDNLEDELFELKEKHVNLMASVKILNNNENIE